MGSCLALAFIMLLAQYEKTLVTKLLYNISEVFVLVNLVILLRILTLWLTLDIMLFTLGVWCRPLVIYTPSILSLSDCCMPMWWFACDNKFCFVWVNFQIINVVVAF